MNLPLESSPSIGNGRFLIQKKLGSGAFGDVFCAYDRRLETVVALKTLQRAEPAAIYHFKNEFRSLAGVVHPNLVQLFELLSEGRRWFFTMELVEGLNFVEYAGSCFEEPPDTTEVHPFPAPILRHDFERLRRSLRQLAEGLCALHKAGRMHCDIKPTNIRVTSQGRLVLFDFGLVHDLRRQSQIFQTMAGEVRGTPAYMSPEQAVGQGVSEASDWYAVGGVLYEALTGKLPFGGTALEVLKAKQLRDGPSPSREVPYLPDDLAELCASLLKRDRAQRPTGEEVLRRLGGGSGSMLEVFGADRGPFIGREMQLNTLDEVFEQTLLGKAGAVFVGGGEGMGKTSLVGRFLDRIRGRYSDLVCLSGKCYERETVPFKGLDSLIDTLSRYLKQLPYEDAAALMPDDVQALARLFPALRRVEAVASASGPDSQNQSGKETRRQARSALRELMWRLARQVKVVLFIDDLQWSERDSAELLAGMMAGSDPPALMIVGCFRVEDSELESETRSRPLLYHFLRRLENRCVEVQNITVNRLWFSESCDLAQELLGDRRAPALSLAQNIARESGGSPLFVSEMVRHVRAELLGGPRFGESGEASPRPLTLEDLIRRRLDKLSAEARHLLELVAVCGRSVGLETVFAAADLGESSQPALRTLLAAGLLRLCGTLRREVETPHEMVRTTIVAGLESAQEAALRDRLAKTLAQSV